MGVTAASGEITIRLLTLAYCWEHDLRANASRLSEGRTASHVCGSRSTRHDGFDVGLVAAVNDAAGERHQRLDPAGRLLGEGGAGLVLRDFAHGLADRAQD